MGLRRTPFIATLIVLLCFLSLGIATVASPVARRAILGAKQRPTATTGRPPVAAPSVIDGHLEFGSNKVYRNVTIRGGLSNAAGAHDTTFINCRILGVGQNETMRLGDVSGSCYDVKFVNCRFARPDGTGGVIVMKPLGDRTDGAGQLHDITFTGCHFGTANSAGERGSAAMMVEIQDYSEGPANHGFYNIDFVGCVFEAGDMATLDFAGTQQGYLGGTILDGDSVVKDCLFKGYCRLEDQAPWTGCLVLEMVRGVRVEGNIFYKGWAFTVSSSTRAGAADQATHNVISGNTFDFRVETGIDQKRPGFARTALIEGSGDSFTNNHFYLPPRVIPASDLFVVAPGNTSTDNRVLH